MDVALKIVDIAWKIKTIVDNVRANNKRCKRLNDRISVLVPLIQQLHGKKSIKSKYTIALERLLVCVERCYTFIKTFTESNWFIRIYDQACHRETFDELSQTLFSCAEDLNLSLAVQQYFKSEQDDADRRNDREFLTKNFDKIILLQSQYAQQQKAQLGNIERMLQSLMDNNKQNLDALTDDVKRQTMHDEEKLFVHVQYNQVNLEQFIATASSGNVYRGRWSHSKVVIKELKICALKGQERQEFIKAVTTLTRIRHENIVQFLGACIEEPDRYLVLSEFMPLGSLYAALRARKFEFTWDDRWSIAKHITNAILYLHTFCTPPIIHKDVKSSNVLLDYYGGNRGKFRAKVNDFGLDQIHASIGTLASSAPETLRTIARRTFTMASDVYSLGVVMWELATAEVPYVNESPEDIIRLICDGHQLPLSYDDVPRIYGNILYQTWNEDVEERLTCEQVYARLVIGSKRVDGKEELWPDTVESSPIHLDPPNVLDYILTLKYQSDQRPEKRDIHAILTAAKKILNMNENNPKPISASAIEDLIIIGESYLEMNSDAKMYISVTCELFSIFAQNPQMNVVIVEQGGVLFLLHVIQAYASKDEAIVKKAGDALSKLNYDSAVNSQGNNQIYNRTVSDTTDQENGSEFVLTSEEEDPTIVLRQVVEEVQVKGHANQRVLTMIEELLEGEPKEDSDKRTHKKKSKEHSSKKKWRISNLFGSKHSTTKKDDH